MVAAAGGEGRDGGQNGRGSAGGRGAIGLRELRKTPFWGSYRPMAREFDLVQLYGLEAVKGVFLPPETPFVAFEHSTMRTLPFEDSVQGRLLNLAYRTADACVITNPDVVGSARRLGLQDYRFIPHPLDETKYTPGEPGSRGCGRRSGGRRGRSWSSCAPPGTSGAGPSTASAATA